MTLADVHALYNEAVSQHPARVRIRSALNTVQRVLQVPLETLPAVISELAPRLSQANPTLAGVRPRQWRDVRYITARGLRDAGLQVLSLRDDTPLTPAWSALQAQLPTRQLQIGLTKFMRYCTRHGVEPSAVVAESFVAFREELAEQTMHGDSTAVHRQTVKLWNRAIDKAPGWPGLAVARDPDTRTYALPWEAFAQSLRNDVEAFLASREGGDVYEDDYRKPVSKETTKGRRQTLRRCASILVAEGAPVDELRSLADLCRDDHALKVLKFLRKRHKEPQVTAGDLNYAHLLKVIARHWVKDEATARRIGDLIAARSVESRGQRLGMTPKNRARIRPFDNVDNHLALLDLPERMLRRVQRLDTPTRHDSVQVMNALIVAMQLRVPVRVKNLAELQLGANIIDMGKGKRRVVKVYLSGSQTKTGREYEAPLPRSVHPLLDAWLKTYRQMVCSKPNAYLFPSPQGELRNRDGLATQVKGFIKRKTGLEFNMHLFRHLAVKVMTEAGPGGLEAGSQLLGHTSTATTGRAYANLKAGPAFRAYDEKLTGLQERGAAGARRRRR